jgi:hypothetical protein
MTLTQSDFTSTFATNALSKESTVLTKTYTISCDTTGCTTKPISYSAEAGDLDAPGAVMHLAVEKGWARSRDQHACPLHVNELDEKLPPLHIHMHPRPFGVSIGHRWR